MKRYLTAMVFLLALVQMAWPQARVEMGKPIFRNFTASEYGAHNRNFDVVCDGRGHVFVANFEGLLVYDGVKWTVHRSKDISRVTALLKDGEGRIWFGGYNILGYARVETSGAVDHVSISWIQDGGKAKEMTAFGCVKAFYEEKGRIQFLSEADEVYSVEEGRIRLKHKVSDGDPLKNKILSDIEEVELVDPVTKFSFRTTKDKGLMVLDNTKREVCRLGEESGLCSDIIYDLASDGHGGIWGTTDNGIFVVNNSMVFTTLGEREGLKGQVNSLLAVDGILYVGTLQGLYYLYGGRMHKEEGVKHACWQLMRTPDGGVLVATAEGVYHSDGKEVSKHTDRHALSVFPDRDDSYLIGEIDGIHRHYYNGEDVCVDSIGNACKMVADGNGGVWAVTLDRETWHKKAGEEHFRKEKNSNVSLLFEYIDDKGYVWKNQMNAKGLVCVNAPEAGKAWLYPLSGYSIQAMYLQDGVAWVGGNFGVVRFNVLSTLGKTPQEHKACIRDFIVDDNSLRFDAALDAFDFFGNILYSYRLSDDDDWSPWRPQQRFSLDNLPYGEYRVQVRVKDMYGRLVLSDAVEFELPMPFFERWYANLFYAFLLLLMSYGIYRWRMLRMRMEKEKLERLVDERTQELKEMHTQLVRKEKEATAGALTKGLIDRILNPMNYINNFSHLTLGLVRDLKADVEDLGDEDISEKDRTEAAEDAEDVLDMMNQNLEKIEQHGISTTRILKAMEEMLKERNGTVQPCDVGALCQQSVEMLSTYYAKDIEELGISIVWEKPELPIVADVVAEQLNRAIVSMLGNSVYALRKKLEKGRGEGFTPTISLTIVPPSGEEAPSIAIRDNGIGIEETILDKVFDPFFTTKPTGEAPGVGLYLAKQIVEDVGGSVSVTSEKGEWTEFVISLP